MTRQEKPTGEQSPDKKNVVDLKEEAKKRGKLDTKSEPWKADLLKNTTGKAEPCVENAIVALRKAPDLKGLLRYNAFAHIIDLSVRPPWETENPWKVRAWTDRDEILLAAWMQRAKINVSITTVADAVHVVARDNSYHPVKDYLISLKWDGIARLSTWLTVYLGAILSPYHEAVGPRWLISAVARIMSPGSNCKAENVLILEGDQGLLKSTALKTLAVNGAWFIDDLRRFGGREPAMQLAGRWIVELAELTAMNDVTIEACKGFLSQNMDNYRPPYGRQVVEVSRQCVFAASTNKNVFLRDETGDRRYWPVTCEKTDIPGLERDRDQLWAEAVHLYNQGHPWWLETPDLRALAEEEQAARFDADPWEMRVKNWLVGYEKVTPEQVLENLFNMEIETVTKIHRNRISAILRHLRWKRVRLRGKDVVDMGTEYVWIQPLRKTVPIN